MIKTELIQEELIFTNVEAKTHDELFCFIGIKLLDLGYVTESFIHAIVNREKEYPTGLALEGFNVAIPHTNCIHITKPFIALVKTVHKIPFIHMGTDDMIIDTDCFFILGIKDPSGQVMLLQTLMDNFNKKTFVDALKSSDDKQKLYEFLQTTF